MKSGAAVGIEAQDVLTRESRADAVYHTASAWTNTGMRKEASSFRKMLLEFADEYELLQAENAVLQTENQHFMRSAALFADLKSDAPPLGAGLFRTFAAQQDFSGTRRAAVPQESHRNVLATQWSASPANSRVVPTLSAPSRLEDMQVGENPLSGIHLTISESSGTSDFVPKERLDYDSSPRCTIEGHCMIANVSDSNQIGTQIYSQMVGECKSPSVRSPSVKSTNGEASSPRESRSPREHGKFSINTFIPTPGPRANERVSTVSDMFGTSSTRWSRVDTLGSNNNAFMMRMSQLFPRWYDPRKSNGIYGEAGAEQSPVMRSLSAPGTEALGSYAYAMGDSSSQGKCLLGPVSRIRLSWDLLATILLFCELWTTPFELIFVPGIRVHFLQLLNYSITAFFTVDILLNFSTGFIEGTRSVIMDRSRIIRHYLKSWFIVDLIATVPVDLILASAEGDFFAAARLGKSSKMFKTFRYLKLIRAVRMLRTIKRARNVHFHDEDHWLARALFWPVVVSMLFAVLSHFNGALYAALQPGWAACETVADGLLRYYDSFTFAYVKLIGITTETQRSSLPGLWTFDCFVASERLVLLVICGRRLSMWALSLEEQAREKVIRENARQYLRRRNVSFRTQLEVLYSIQETAKAQNMQKHFKELCSNDMPMQLRRTISQELWSTKLMSLGLLLHIAHWNDDFVNELALMVREEIFPSNACVFREGEAAIAAYYIIEGELSVYGSMSPAGSIPDYVAGMWLGEKALVNPMLRRAASVTTKVLAMVMTISAVAFQDLLTYLGLMCKFQTFCSEQLWRGLCGRCGVLGDHFADTCPKICGYEYVQRLSSEKFERDKSAGRRFSVLSSSWAEVGSVKSALPTTRMMSILSGRPVGSKQEDRESSRRSESRAKDLKRFLQRHKKEHLMPVLKDMDIGCLEHLEEVDPAQLKMKLDLSEAEMRSLSRESICKFREQTARAVHKMFFDTKPKSQYLVFLSHHKEGAGTEAALLRTELISAIAQDAGSPASSFETPVFLDSEDLQNLSDVQERVAMSHNLVVLLTNDVFTRPWVLVELVTARRSGLRILPVRVCKPANEFEMPGEEFYQSLSAGKVLSTESAKILSDCDIDVAEVAKVIRQMFNRIMIPYSPHRSEAVRQAEVRDLLKQCALKSRPQRQSKQSLDSSEVQAGAGASDYRPNIEMRRNSWDSGSLVKEAELSAIVGDFSDCRDSSSSRRPITVQEDAELGLRSRTSGISAYSDRAI